MKRSVLAATLVALFPTLAAAGGPIERACLKSDRQAATPATCHCIQQVADMTLDRGDQRRAARFFADPEQAQDVRLSDRDTDARFWARYSSFGDAAQAFCAG